jgi:polyisoprenoid-binding protein YceI
MKHRIAAALAIATLASASGALAQTSRWEVDPVHSNVAFSVRHMMISNVRGVFTKFSGVLEGNSADVGTAKINVTIDATSIDTRETARDKDLMGPNYLDVVKFPTLTFVSKKVETAGEGHVKVTGDLTIHGVTRPVVLDVEGVTPPMKDPWGGTRVGAHATTTINRKDFGLVWNKTLETGGVLVGEDVAITLDVELVKKA